MSTILEQARAAGYAEGYDDGRNWNGQYLMCVKDEAFCAGRIDALEGAPSRLRWFVLGLIVGLAALLF